MNTLLLVPDGVSVRNFLLSSLPEALAAIGPVDVLFGSGLSAVRDTTAAVRHVDEMIGYPEHPIEAFTRRTMEYSHLRWCDTEGTRFNLEARIPGTSRARAVRGAARTASALTTGSRLPHLVSAHNRLADRRTEVDHYVDLLETQSTDVVLCAHQRPLQVLPVIMAARRLGIPTATFIFSWDNLTTKGRIAAPFDHFFVWSDQMAAELSQYYPDVSDDRVHVVGSPQFDPHGDQSIVWSRVSFADRLGLDSDRPVICYSGGDTLTCPEDPEHLRVLAELVRSGKVPGKPQVVLRPAPVDVSERYDAVLREFDITLARPSWTTLGSGWTTIVPTRDDVQMLVNLTIHADLNINMASTMTLDFAVHDTPVVNLGFDIDPSLRLAPRYYRFDHYRPVVEMGAARVAVGPEELAEHAANYLLDPSLDRESRARFVSHELRVRPGESVGMICAALQRIASTTVSDGAPGGALRNA